jgi:hypothetical protein
MDFAQVAESAGSWEDALHEFDVRWDDALVNEIYDQSRWSTFTRYVYLVDGRYWEIIDEQGSTEYQEGGDFSFEINEVTPVTVQKVDYVRVAK